MQSENFIIKYFICTVSQFKLLSTKSGCEFRRSFIQFQSYLINFSLNIYVYTVVKIAPKALSL